MTSITAEEEAALIERYHRNNIAPGQTCKVQTKRINAPIETVWSFVRRFDNPREFRSTITRCEIINDIVPDTIGCIRRVEIIPGMSVKESVERLHTFDEINYQIGFELIGGDLGLEVWSYLHRYKQYVNAYSVEGKFDEQVGRDFPVQSGSEELTILDIQ
ncbi:hypothetical protein KP509_24G046400 [Ceratopteris richardii]|uniref:Uncharacterized protein n=1 Tax=Ceratopteris richardii TaxID=49495 RepID=A0A8T2RWQ2_CERRI|nr:hypothetical protein KP509_24G046400 [Ceratopteris richardii]KAH7300144.1 hypothetical protein KP509_24G046400 [Ceratopteris richardii]